MLGVSGQRAYAALGDSYSSGLGVGKPYTGGSCFRSVQAWPLDMQTAWNADTVLLACAGAKIADVRAQMASMSTFFAKSSNAGRAQLVTVTVGGNDANFVSELVLCSVGNCLGRESAINSTIDSLRAPLQSLYAALRSDLDYADIVVGGYPGVVHDPPGTRNPVCAGFGAGEAAMIQRLAARLNGVVNSAATSAGVWSASANVYNRFVSHEACSSSEYINSLVFGFSSTTDESFHPNLGGQLEYAYAYSDLILAKAG